jgi:hypothetical protein
MFKYGLRCAGEERGGANSFSGIMNIPPTITQIDKEIRALRTCSENVSILS